MQKAFEIRSLSQQLKAVADKIDTLAGGIADTDAQYPELAEMYHNLLLDEIEHTQILALELTRMMAETENGVDSDSHADEGDGSAFGPGELTSTLGEKEQEEPAETEVEK